MKNVTFTEWHEHLVALHLTVQRRWPELAVTVDAYSLHAGNECLRGFGTVGPKPR